MSLLKPCFRCGAEVKVDHITHRGGGWRYIPCHACSSMDGGTINITDHMAQARGQTLEDFWNSISYDKENNRALFMMEVRSPDREDLLNALTSALIAAHGRDRDGLMKAREVLEKYSRDRANGVWTYWNNRIPPREAA